MNFESQNSALKSTGDSDNALSANTLIGDDVRVECNGCCEHDDGHDLNANGNGYPEPSLDLKKPMEEAEKLNFDDRENVESRPDYGSLHSNRSTSGDYVDAVSLIHLGGKGNENDQTVMDSPVSPVEVPLGSPAMSPPTSGTKGKGLRKWRRIRREFVKDATPSKVSTKMLKRGTPNLLNPSVATDEMMRKSEGSESSINAIWHNPSSADAFPVVGSSSVYKLAGSPAFSPGAVSDEERSSKSSSAASFPKSSHDLPRASGHSRDKHRTKHISGKHSGNTSQMLQQGTDQVDASKKARGEACNMDKENSLSSLESDSRNYGSVFMGGSSSAINNGQSYSYVVEQSDDGPAVEQQSVEGPPTGTSESIEDENVLQGEAALSWKIRGREKNYHLSGNRDPLVDCVEMLQSAQDALEQEIKKFGELGNDLRPLDDDSIRACGLGPEVCGSSSAEWPTLEDSGREVSAALKAILEKQVEQAKAMLKEKESRITELETTINNLKSSGEDLGRSINIQQKKCEEIEAEVEILFQEKMEAQIQYLAIIDTSIIVENQMKLLLTEQKSLVREQAQEMQKTCHLEGEVEETGKMQKRVAKFTFCFFIQLILFIFVLVLFISQFLPKTEVVLPT